MSTIPEIDHMMTEWARQTRRIANESGYAKASPQNGACDHFGGLGSFIVSQYMQEGLVGDARQVHRALYGDKTTGRGGAPRQLIRFACRIYLQCEPEEIPPVVVDWSRQRTKLLARILDVSPATFWQVKGNLHHWIAARVPHGTNCLDDAYTKYTPPRLDESAA